MNTAITNLAAVVFVIDLGVAAASWLAILIYGVQAIRRRKPGVNLWGGATLWNPANALLDPELLTGEGLAYRRKCFLAIAIFMLSAGVPLLFGLAVGKLK